jgi:hypothetical protein
MSRPFQLRIGHFAAGVSPNDEKSLWDKRFIGATSQLH